jgi:hypothetical protein
MNRDYFWLTEDQFARLQLLLPTDTRCKPRVDDRRVISAGRIASRPFSIGIAMRSSACSAGSRTSVASPRAMTDRLPTSSPPSVSPPPLAIGYELGIQRFSA